MVVRDDWWHASFGQPALLGLLSSDLRVARSTGTIEVLTTYELADAQQVPGADRVLSRFGTRVLLEQDTRELAQQPEAHRLTRADVDELARTRGPGSTGRGVWQIGERSHYASLALRTAEADVATRRPGHSGVR